MSRRRNTWSRHHSSPRRRTIGVATVIAAAAAAALVAVSVAVGAGWIPIAGLTPSPVIAASECTIAPAIDEWDHGSLHVDVRDVSSGEHLLGLRGDVAASTGSTMKVLTAAAAVTSLGPDSTIATRVVQGTAADTVIIVGGGDPTLSRLSSGRDGVYPGAAHLDDLAKQVLSAREGDPRLAGVPIRRLDVDASLFTGPAWEASWPESARSSGSISNVTALMVDGDRDDPSAHYSPRSSSAVTRAAGAFADLLGADVVVGDLVAAPATAHELGVVRSAPVRDLVAHMLTSSDNTLAESLARLVAIAEGAGSGSAAIDEGTSAALSRLGLGTDGLLLVDGSGLSRDNAVPAAFLTSLLVEVGRHTGELAAVDDGLAVAGRTGTLAENGRFTGPDADAAGRIRAKSGTLTDMSGLAGLADAADGTTVAFTIWAEGTPEGTAATSARAAVDGLAAEIVRCGATVSAAR